MTHAQAIHAADMVGKLYAAGMPYADALAYVLSISAPADHRRDTTGATLTATSTKARGGCLHHPKQPQSQRNRATAAVWPKRSSSSVVEPPPCKRETPVRFGRAAKPLYRRPERFK